jgi:CSLREA domain-containing protein
MPAIPAHTTPVASPGRAHAGIVRNARCACALLFAAWAPALLAVTFTVNSVVDVPDANPGDGICRTAPDNSVCTLRAAIMESNALPGLDRIDLQANVTYVLTRSGKDDTGLNGDLDVLDSVTIVGAGAASTIIDGNGVATGDRIMEVVRCIGNAALVMGECPGGAVVEADISGIAFRHGNPSYPSLGGGAVRANGRVTLANCAFSDNAADEPGTYGGAIAVGSEKTTVIGSTINNNHAANSGGGIIVSNASLIVINSTVVANSANDLGGGIAAFYGSAGLYNVTIAGNTANADAANTGNGGGVATYSSTIVLTNSILTGNAHRNDGSLFITPDDASGSITSSGHNIISHPVSVVGGDYSTGNRMLGRLMNIGGQTLTPALRPGSAALDSGEPTGCTDDLGQILDIDQRGYPRPVNGCDLGAFEFVDEIFADDFDA